MGVKLSKDKNFGRYFALSQVGFEMVVPIVLGVYLDSKFGWGPWGVTVGAVLGLVGGMIHLIVMVQRFEEKDPPPSQDSH